MKKNLATSTLIMCWLCLMKNNAILNTTRYCESLISAAATILISASTLTYTRIYPPICPLAQGWSQIGARRICFVETLLSSRSVTSMHLMVLLVVVCKTSAKANDYDVFGTAHRATRVHSTAFVLSISWRARSLVRSFAYKRMGPKRYSWGWCKCAYKSSIEQEPDGLKDAEKLRIRF